MNSSYDEFIAVVRSTRSLSLPLFGKVEAQAQKTSSATDVVTQVDFQIEKYLAEEFSRLDSSIGFVGEEYGGDSSAKCFWLVDPIDGTAHYMRGLPFSTTMVALIEDGQVVFSAIYDFVNDRLYHAELGKGAFCNDERISVSNRLTSSAYVSFESKLQTEADKATYFKLRDQASLVSALCSGWEFAMVASGMLDGRICLNPFGKQYDFAPGSLLVSEAGGVVRNLGSSAYSYENLDMIAANPTVYESLTNGENALFPVDN